MVGMSVLNLCPPSDLDFAAFIHIRHRWALYNRNGYWNPT